MINYMIQQGDTLYKIANQYNVTVQEIIDANPNINPFNLYAGQIIQIPSQNTYQGQLSSQQRMQLPTQQPQQQQQPK